MNSRRLYWVSIAAYFICTKRLWRQKVGKRTVQPLVIQFAPKSFRTEVYMTLGHSTLWAGAALMIVLTAPNQAQQPSTSSTAGPQVLPVQGGQIRVVTIASGLFHPWSLAFLPDGRTLLVAE